MDFKRPQTPDVEPVRHMLRGLRGVLKEGRDRFAREIPDRLPTPASVAARALLHGVDQMAHDIDRLAVNISHGLRSTSPTKDDAGRPRAHPLADAFMGALAAARRQRALPDAAMPDDAVVRTAFAVACGPDGPFEPDGAASLTLALLAGSEGGDAADRGRAVVIFGAALSLLASCDGETSASILRSAVDLSAALSDDILGACKSGDGAALADLYRKYRAHV